MDSLVAYAKKLFHDTPIEVDFDATAWKGGSLSIWYRDRQLLHIALDTPKSVTFNTFRYGKVTAHRSAENVKRSLRRIKEQLP